MYNQEANHLDLLFEKEVTDGETVMRTDINCRFIGRSVTGRRSSILPGPGA